MLKRILLVLVFILLVVLATAFTVLNAGTAQLNLYLYSVEAPISILVFVCLVIGALLGLVAAAGTVLKRGHEIRRLKKKLATCEEEVLNLRNIPIKDRH